MEVITYQTAQEFLARTQAILEENETVSSLILGICMRLANQPPADSEDKPFLATVDDEAGPVLAALMTPPFRLSLASCRANPEAALDGLVAALQTDGVILPGVVGPLPLADDFAARWGALNNQVYPVAVYMRAYELTEVQPPQNVAGRGRIADRDDLDLILQWALAFEADINNTGPSNLDKLRESLISRIESRQIYLWYDGGQPVSMAAKARPTRHGTTVNLVYTPPDLRGHGYASAVTAAVSQAILDDGKRFATLFTDLSNPTSNNIYQKIGYRPVIDFNEYDF